MRAVYIERFGGPEVLSYGDIPDPVPAEDEVLIDVAAASVKAANWKQRLELCRSRPAAHSRP